MPSHTNGFYVCSVCGAEVAVVKGAGGTLTCCGKPMDLQSENTTDAATEKHVPVVTKTAEGIKVTVGEVAHPMTDGHLIEWIEVQVGATIMRKNLTPADAPEALFAIGDAEPDVVRAYCNTHGLWKTS